MAYRTMKTTSQMGNDVTSQIGNTISVCLMSRLLWENYSTPFTRERCRRDWYKQSHKMPPDGWCLCFAVAGASGALAYQSALQTRETGPLRARGPQSTPIRRSAAGARTMAKQKDRSKSPLGRS